MTMVMMKVEMRVMNLVINQMVIFEEKTLF